MGTSQLVSKHYRYNILRTIIFSKTMARIHIYTHIRTIVVSTSIWPLPHLTPGVVARPSYFLSLFLCDSSHTRALHLSLSLRRCLLSILGTRAHRPSSESAEVTPPSPLLGENHPYMVLQICPAPHHLSSSSSCRSLPRRFWPPPQAHHWQTPPP
jgi:hypothetical protein